MCFGFDESQKVQMFFYNETVLPDISAIIPSILRVSIFRAEFAEFVFSFRLWERIGGGITVQAKYQMAGTLLI